MSVHKPLPPSNKSLSASNVQLYDIGCNDFLLDTRKAVSNAGFSKSNNAKKELRRMQLPFTSESAKDVRIRTNKMLQIQNRMWKGIFKEFVKSAGIKDLQTLHDVNSEERSWKQNDIEDQSHLPTISQSRLMLIKSKTATNWNIYGGNVSISSSQFYVDIVKLIDIDRSKINLLCIPEDNWKSEERISPESLFSPLEFNKSTDNINRVESFQPTTHINPQPSTPAVVKPNEAKIKIKTNQMRVDDIIFQTCHDNVKESEIKDEVSVSSLKVDLLETKYAKRKLKTSLNRAVPARRKAREAVQRAPKKGVEEEAERQEAIAARNAAFANARLLYQNPPLEELLQDPNLGTFITPPRVSKPAKGKGKKKEKAKPVKKSPLNPPQQPPTGLCFQTYKDEEPDEVIVKPVLEFTYQRTHNSELNRAMATLKQGRQNRERLVRPWHQGRVAFSKQICRFELPVDIGTLRGMTPVEYITDYSVITPRRIKLYKAAFDRQLMLRKPNLRARGLPQNSPQPKPITTATPPGGTPTKKGKTADVAAATQNNATKKLVVEETLTLKEAADGLEQIHVGDVEDQQVDKMFRLLCLIEDDNGDDGGGSSLKDSKVTVNCKLFCAMCALLERTFYLDSLVDDHTTRESGSRIMLELADFFGFNVKIEDFPLRPALRELFNILTK